MPELQKQVEDLVSCYSLLTRWALWQPRGFLWLLSCLSPGSLNSWPDVQTTGNQREWFLGVCSRPPGSPGGGSGQPETRVPWWV